MKGYLASKGVHISDWRLRSALARASPINHQQRQHGRVQCTNPHVYYAYYFGHKIHVDQNEKCAMYGLTYVIARDGYSGKIVGAATMSVKNNLVIYDKVYRAAVIEYGLWDQVRVDHGREFYLMLFIQEKLREQRGNPDLTPYQQTSSQKNHVIERIWVELNQRVTYPIKRIVASMVNQGSLDIKSDMVKYCVSTVIQAVAHVGMQRMISAWNAHSIPRRGIPNVLQRQQTGTTVIHPLEIPTVDEASHQYREQGGSLTDPHTFGHDPLADDDDLQQQRDREFSQRCPLCYADIFSALVSGDRGPLQNALEAFVAITENLSS